MSTDSTSALQRHLSNSNAQRSLSLRDRVTALALRADSNILLLDTSGSMSGDVTRGESKIEILWSIVQQLRAQAIPFRTAEFNNECNWSDGVAMPRPSGSTALASALEYVASVSPQQITLVTDGYPNNPEAALEVASLLQCKINVLYVGPSSDYRAIDFCQRLAAACGGSYAHNSLTSELLQLQASESARLMLTAGQTQSDNKPSVINL